MSVTSIRNHASSTARSAIIFIHGLGDSGEGWSWFPQVIQQTNIVKSFPEINFVFPNAPTIPITVNGGMRMPAWFDIYEFGNPNAKQDVDGFLKSCNVLKELIHEQIEKHNIPAERIIIGGFSQGAAISMATLALLDVKIGGLVALSGFCPITKTIAEKQNKSGTNLNTPVFQGHGHVDPIIKFSYGKDTSEFYQSLGFTNWKFHDYPGVAHSTDNKELVDVIQFISLILD
ncbi:CIC11C00000004129 [Sungouiella intermedia]|uniref:Acyl-protein thioesterase 1 n=1 Tax=Sungouiella intermedia TaxID=45354 RepID=A0A1L0BH33_9ASCO|nr:CIC11C00000004129 [[Candida] intermedia]